MDVWLLAHPPPGDAITSYVTGALPVLSTTASLLPAVIDHLIRWAANGVRCPLVADALPTGAAFDPPNP